MAYIYVLGTTNSQLNKRSMLKYFFAILIVFISSCSSSNNSSCLLQATYDSGPSSSFNFREDGTFEYTSGSGLGVSQTEGKYQLTDKLITLDKIGFDKVIKSKLLLLTTIHPISHVKGKYLVQVGDGNKLIDSMFIFTVYIDNRNLLK